RTGIDYRAREAGARALKARLHQGGSLLVIGGGLIGLEVAASAAELGVKTAVVEIAPRILARVCNAEISALIHERHRARGVDIRVGITVSALRELPDGRLAVDLATGDTIAADLIVVGTGVAPDDRLAKAAVLATQDGIIVDDHARTSDAAIFAAGDCTRFPGPHGPVRLENWRHAQEHGAIAGRNAAGGDVVYKVAPSFWSEQHDMYIQGVGWPVRTCCLGGATGLVYSGGGLAGREPERAGAPAARRTCRAHVRAGRRPPRARVGHQCAAGHGDGAAADRARGTGRRQRARRYRQAARCHAQGEGIVAIAEHDDEHL